MIGKNFKYNGELISRKTEQYQIALTDVNWYKLDVSDEQHNIQGYHGIRVSPTYARGRRIEIQGLIIADTRGASYQAIDFLRNLFALQYITEKTEFKPFSFEDDNSNIWIINCKIKEPLDIELMEEDYPEGMPRKWRVVLQAQDPYIYSYYLNTVIGLEGNYGGTKLQTKLGTKLNEYYNEILAINNGNTAAPVKITINTSSTINRPLTIKNITTGRWFKLDIDANPGDTIVIDTQKHTATKNGQNILAYRMEGSYWIKVQPGINYFTVYDLDGGLYESDVNITIEYRDTLL